MSLKEGHNRAIHKPEEGEYSGDEYPRHSERRIISRKPKPNSKREKDNNPPETRSQSEYIPHDILDFFMIIFVFRYLSNRDSIESKVGDDGEYGEIVIDLGIEPIPRDIEVVCEDLDEENGDERGRHFSGDLCKSIRIDFFGGHL